VAAAGLLRVVDVAAPLEDVVAVQHLLVMVLVVVLLHGAGQAVDVRDVPQEGVQPVVILPPLGVAVLQVMFLLCVDVVQGRGGGLVVVDVELELLLRVVLLQVLMWGSLIQLILILFL
jgi:hypothetical protein